MNEAKTKLRVKRLMMKAKALDEAKYEAKKETKAYTNEDRCGHG